jgi:hypothetical protein
LRLRHATLRNPLRLRQLQQTLGQWPQIQVMTPNARTGSLLLIYDALALPEAECVQRCEAALAALQPGTGGAPLTLPRPARPRGAGGRAKRANRLAKHGMLASLTASLALAALGVKRAHVWTGIAFLHALGVHLWVHRRNLLR